VDVLVIVTGIMVGFLMPVTMIGVVTGQTELPIRMRVVVDALLDVVASTVEFNAWSPSFIKSNVVLDVTQDVVLVVPVVWLSSLAATDDDVDVVELSVRDVVELAVRDDVDVVELGKVVRSIIGTILKLWFSLLEFGSATGHRSLACSDCRRPHP